MNLRFNEIPELLDQTKYPYDARFQFGRHGGMHSDSAFNQIFLNDFLGAVENAVHSLNP